MNSREIRKLMEQLTLLESEEIFLEEEDLYPIVSKVWRSKYPDVGLWANTEGFGYIFSSDPDEDDEGTQIAPGEAADGFDLQFAAHNEDDPDELVIAVDWGYSSQFPGVISSVFELVFRKMEQMNPNGKRVLAISGMGDSSGGAWQQMAKKLNAEYSGREA